MEDAEKQREGGGREKMRRESADGEEDEGEWNERGMDRGRKKRVCVSE